MFNVDLICVVSTLDTEELKNYFVSDGTETFYSPFVYQLKLDDNNMKLSLVKYMGEIFDLEWSHLKPSFCGLNKREDTIEVIFYLKLPPDHETGETQYKIKSQIARESEYVRKTDVYV